MRKFHGINSIRTKLLIISIIILTVPSLVLGTLSYFKSKEALDDSGVKRLQTSVELILEMIDSYQEDVEKGTITLEDAQEKVKIAILGEKDAKGNRPINPRIDLGKNGFMFILDQDGTMLAHPEKEGENVWEDEGENGEKFAQEMIRVGNEGGGITYYEQPLPDNASRIAPKVTYAKTAPDWGWVVNASTYMMDFNHSAKEIFKSIYTVIGITFLVGNTVVWIFINRISRPINEVVEQMDRIAQADLSGEQLKVKSSDETGRLAHAINEMQDGLQEMIGNVLDAANTLASQSEELTQASQEVSEGTEQVAITMEELATGTETQANRSGEIATMMSNFVTKIEEANSEGDRVSETSKDVLTMTKEGHRLMEDSTRQMEAIDKIVHDAVAKVEGLDTHSQQISELVSVIQGIAEQTNLLALNAAIEAARAGEHGQGFAVVADEVRKLAEESASSVIHITEIVERIQSESTLVANSLKVGYEEVEQGTLQITATGETFDQIHTAVMEMVERIQAISNNLEDIVSNSQEVNAAIEDIAAVSEESAAGVEETTAATEQANATMQQVAASSNDLAILAERLQDLVKEFKL